MKARMASSSFSIGLAKPAATARVGGSKGALWGVETVKRSLFGSSPAGPVATAGVGYNKVERFGRTGSKRIYAEVKRSERASLGAEWMTNLLRVVPLSRPLQEARARLRLHLHSLMRMYSLMVCTGAHLGVLGALGVCPIFGECAALWSAQAHIWVFLVPPVAFSGQVCSSGWGAALGEGIALNEGVASFSVATDNLSTCARLPLLKAQACAKQSGGNQASCSFIRHSAVKRSKVKANQAVCSFIYYSAVRRGKLEANQASCGFICHSAVRRGSVKANQAVCSSMCLSAVNRSNQSQDVHAWSTSAIAVGHRHAWLINDARAVLLDVISPGEVEVWEGFVTLAFFPLMVLTAYAVDKKFWLWSSGQ
eukprot:scaffold215500_cov18-Tisochrysis_lutea.AAC.2